MCRFNPIWGNPQRNVKAKEVGVFSRLGTEPLKRSIVNVSVPGAKVSISAMRIHPHTPLFPMPVMG